MRNAAVAKGTDHLGDDDLIAIEPLRLDSQFGLQGALHDGLGKLLQNPVLADQVFRFLLIGKQKIDQVGLYYFAFGHVFPCRRQCPA